MKAHVTAKLLLPLVVLLGAPSPSAGVPDWLDNLLGPARGESDGKPRSSSIDTHAATPQATPQAYPARTTVGTFFAQTTVRLDGTSDIDSDTDLLAAMRDIEASIPSRGGSDDEFILYSPPSSLDDDLPSVFGRDSTDTATDPEWLTQLAHMFTVVLGWFGVNRRAHAGCRGAGGVGRGGDRGGRDDDEPSLLDRVGDAVSGFFSDMGQGLMDALGMEDDERADIHDPLPDSAEGRIARWRSYARSWFTEGGGGGRGGVGHGHGGAERDLGTLRWDVKRLKQCGEVKDMIQRIVQEFIGKYPAIGYTQGFEYACTAILNALGTKEAPTVDVFNAWATSVGRVITNEVGRQKAAQYAFERSSRTTRNLLLADELMDLKALEEEEKAATLFVHLFNSPVSSMCARLGLPENVQAKIIDKTLRAGEDGPDVCIWVTMALLSLAHRDAELMKKAGMSKGKLCEAAARKVSSFADLEKAADTKLPSFLRGHRKALR